MIITVKSTKGIYMKKSIIIARNNKVETSPSTLVIIVNESDLNFLGKSQRLSVCLFKKNSVIYYLQEALQRYKVHRKRQMRQILRGRNAALFMYTLFIFKAENIIKDGALLHNDKRNNSGK